MNFKFQSSGYGMFPENFQSRSRFAPIVAFEPDNGAGSGTQPTPDPAPAPPEDVTGLKSALQKERDGRSTLEKQFKQLQESVKGIDPEKYKQFEQLQAEAEKWNQREAEMKTTLETQYQTQIQAEQQKVKDWEGKYQELLKRGEAEKAFQAANGRSGGGEDGVTFFEMFYSSIGKALKLNDQGQLEVVDGNGVRLFSKKDASKPMGAAEYFSGLVAHPVYAHHFGPNEKAKGSGTQPGSTNSGTNPHRDLSGMNRAARLTALREGR
ncbi:hypothetical protein H6F43_17040 [Leptolyngbya sp. FACHB-36]|uniref:hypothetical protein n=1 Tax=Leptolyngbya sp. FACHB-36 TaxID=2692808 RepID=UPI0016800787|nr:hypothetical protein [Leptolyngbya sp. FACHB-36]MBD2021889.1 hypothetical protein [Leptolyngbya sp. FACHB-36]